ncbi:hypothetical protein [Chitinophaga nivalis]|uniref:Uncharacterized protein n=1 Tax=Chitinophaga nivalis TaxID=2991709 RepID=A0ABT3IS51_9BACT|nr:hypothetical protein [Chitinophaga nivalis]MCW3463507.1 hypothetical protein [Chitinophaga nivalis]MCW3486803.1 hypothetical protein [Chitinophaga nivalis]
MDILDNIIYAHLNSKLQDNTLIHSDFIPDFSAPAPKPVNATRPVKIYTYSPEDKFKYQAYEDVSSIEKAINLHWYDVNNAKKYKLPGGETVSDFAITTTYHLISPYLIENTKLLLVMEKLIEKYMHDEDLGLAVGMANGEVVFNWLQNAEKLFFKSDYPRAGNVRSLLRTSADATRRNAYWRMFGMDLAFGDNNPGTGYYKAQASNQEFVALFEKYLAEIWQGFQNARNTSGPNTTDVNVICELAIDLNDRLLARRGAALGTTKYANQNLAREEFAAVLITTWFTLPFTFNSPFVELFNLKSSVIGDRVARAGNKAGIMIHNKSQALFEMAGPAAIVLSAIELGDALTDPTYIQGLLSSLNPGVVRPVEAELMNHFLTVINNWEKATSHRIKNPAANLNGKVVITDTTRNKLGLPLK